MKPTLIVMAAGMGSRYGGLKQMDAVGPNGETLLEYSVYDAIQAGFGKVVFVIRSDFESDFREQVGSRFANRIDVQYAFQSLNDLPHGFTVPEGRTKPWGTAQAVLACKDLVQEPFIVQNADDFYGAEAYRIIADQIGGMDNDEACMVGYQIRNTLSPHGSVSRGICETSDSLVTGIMERTNIILSEEGAIEIHEEDSAVEIMTGDELCSMNFWGFNPSFFSTLQEGFILFLKNQGRELKSEWYIPYVVDEMIESGQMRVRILNSNAKWFGVTYPDDKSSVVASLRQMHEDGEYPPVLWS